MRRHGSIIAVVWACLLCSFAHAAPPPATDLGLVSNQTLTVQSTPAALTPMSTSIAVFNNSGTLLDLQHGYAEGGLGGNVVPAVSSLDLSPGTYYVAVWADWFQGSASDGFVTSAGDDAFTISGLSIGGPIHNYTSSPASGSVTFYSVFIERPTTINNSQPYVIPSIATFDIDTLGSDFDTEIGLYGSDGNRIANNDDGGPGFLSLIPDVQLPPGRYFLSISGYNTAFSSTRFQVSTAPDSDGGAFRINFAGVQVRTGTIAEGEFQFIEFVIRDHGDPIDIIERPDILINTVAQASGNSSLAIFRASTGELVAESGTPSGAAIDIPITTPGTYRLMLGTLAMQYADGLFAFGFENFDPFIGSRDLSFGNVTDLPNQVIADPGDIKVYTFFVSSPVNLGQIAHSIQPFHLRTTGDTDTALALWTQDGVLIDSNDDISGSDPLSRIDVPGGLPAGTYYAGVTGGGATYADDFRVMGLDSSTPSGTYKVASIMSNNPDPNINRNLGYPGDVDYFSFQIASPTQVPSTIGVDSPGGTFVWGVTSLGQPSRIGVWNEGGTLIETLPIDDAATSWNLSLDAGVYYFSIGGVSGPWQDDFIIGDGSEILFADLTLGSDDFDILLFGNNRFFRAEIVAVDSIDDAADLGVLPVSDVSTGLYNIITSSLSTFTASVGLWNEQGDLITQSNALGDISNADLDEGVYFFAVAGAPNTFGPDFQVGTEAGESGNFSGVVQSLMTGPTFNVPFSDSILQRQYRYFKFRIGERGCNAADIAEPFGILDLADIGLFVVAFTNQDPIADIAPPFGVFDLGDLGLFVSEFTAGCP